MIYLFDKDEKLIKVVRKPAIKTALQKYSLTKERYVSDRLTVEMKALNDDELEKVEYMAIQTMEDAHKFHYFYVAQKSSENLTTLIGVQSGIEELRKSPVFDKRPQNALAREVINDLLSGTNWQARFVGETTPHSTNFYYISVFDALKKVCEVWDLEMQFFVEMNGNRIGARYIDFKQKIGQAVGKRVVYGHNALQILQEVERTNIFTALIGRGKGEQVSSAEDSGKQANGFGRKITFEDVVWSTASGRPVNKPKGQKYVELPAMTKLYGIKNADGSMRPKIGFVDFAEEENPEQLLERTYKALVNAARPQLALKTSSVYLRGAKIGDTIRVVRHDKRLDYDTRIFDITFNRLNDQSSDIKLGDRIGESNEAKAQTIADKAIDEFVANEFTNFVKNLPDYLPTADGFNNNWYGAEDPTGKHPGKVLINDIWYKPDPEHEGHKIMLRWTGEVWEELLRTFSSEALRAKISDEIEKLNKAMKASDLSLKEQTAQALRTAGTNASAIEAAKGAITKLNQELTGAKQTNQAAIDRLKSDFANAQKTASDQTALLKNDLANIRTKQTQAESEIAKQVAALNATKSELAGVKSAQATFEQSTTRRLAELANVADGKASKSDLVQTAEELKSKIASVQVGGVNLLKGSKDFSGSWSNIGHWTRETEKYKGLTVMSRTGSWLGLSQPFEAKKGETYTFSFYIKSSVERDQASVYFVHNSTNPQARVSLNVSPAVISDEWQRLSVTFKVEESGFILPRIERFNTDNRVYVAGLKLERGTIATDYSENPEDVDGRVSAVESNFKQRADSLEAGVSSLREGLKTKADSSALTLLSDRISASVKSLETDTQNKLNQKLSAAEFEVRASGIRQEIVNATKDKADKALVTAEAGRLREELASLSVGGVNLLKRTKAFDRVNGRSQLLSEAYNNCVVRYFKNADANSAYQDIVEYSNSLYPELSGTYTLSFWAKGTGEMTTFFYGQRGYLPVSSGTTSQGLVSKAGDGNCRFTLSADWHRYYVVYKLKEAPAEATSIYKHVLFRHNSKSTTDEIWLAGVKLERGNLASDYSENPEDTESLITEAKAVFERTAQGLRMDLTAVQAYVNADGTRAEALRTYSREETARQLTAERKLVEAGYVAKATHTEDMRGLIRRFEELNSGGPNLVSNGATELGLKYWPANGKLTADRKHPFFKNSTATMFVLDTTESTIAFMQQNQYNVLKRNTDYTLSFTAFASSNVSGFRALVGLLTNMDHAWKKTLHTYTKSLSPTQAERITVQFNSGDYDGFALRFDNMGSSNGRGATVWISEIDVYEGTMKRPYQPSPANNQSYADTKLAEYKQGIDGQLANVQSALNTANGSLTNFNNWKQSAQETLNKVDRVETGLNETKTSFAEFKRTAEGQLTTISQQITGKASKTEFQRVQETSKLYERLIGSTEKEVTDKVSRMALTNELFQVEVSKNLGLRTVQYQMANAWAVQNLNSNGDIVSQINMTGPNVRIQGESIHLDGKTLIDNGIIKNAMIESMLADKITAGTLNAANVNIINLNANKIVGLDANFIKSKIELAFIEWMKGKVISAQNDAMQIDLNNGQYNVMTNQAAIRRVLNGYPNQFLKFTSETESGAPASVTVLGANRDGTENSKNDSFAGIRLFSGNKVERTEIISDVVRFATGAVNYRGWEMRTLYGNDNRQVILQPFGNVTRSNIVANYFNGIDLVNVLETLNQMMANLGNHTGRHDIFGPIRGLGARKYVR